MPVETIDIVDDLVLLPPQIGGLNTELEGIHLPDQQSPIMVNLICDPGKVRALLGWERLGIRMNLPGNGEDIFVYTDERGNNHLLALTTTDVALFQPDTTTDSTDYDRWLLLTPSIIVEDCEDVWVSNVGANITIASGTLKNRVRETKSLKITFNNAVAAGIVCYEDFAAIDITDDGHGSPTTMNSIGFWTKFVTSSNLSDGDLQIRVSEQANGAGGGTQVDTDITIFPVVDPLKWNFNRVAADLSDCNAIVSTALIATVEIPAGTVVYIDDIRAYAPFTGGDDDKWRHTIFNDEGADYTAGDVNTPLGTYDSGLLITNRTSDGVWFWEGNSIERGFEDFSGQISGGDGGNGDLTNFTTCYDLFELGNHLNLARPTISTQYVKRIVYADIGDANNFATSGTFGDNRLVDSVGEIKRCVRLGKDIIVYSENSITTWTYVSGDKIYTPTVYIDYTGLFSVNAIWAGPGFHIFLGTDKKVYQYSGQRNLVAISPTMDKHIFESLNAAYKYNVCMGYESTDKILFIMYPSSDVATDRGFLFDLSQTPKTWTEVRMSVKGAPLQYPRAFTEWRSVGGAGSWRCNGAYLATTPCNETGLRCNAGFTQEGFSQLVRIDYNGFVWTYTQSLTNQNTFQLQTKDYTVSLLNELYEGRITEYGIRASCGSSPSGYVTVWYSINEGVNWNLLDSALLSQTPANYRFDIDVKAKRIRFRLSGKVDFFLYNHWIRRTPAEHY